MSEYSDRELKMFRDVGLAHKTENTRPQELYEMAYDKVMGNNLKGAAAESVKRLYKVLQIDSYSRGTPEFESLIII